MAKKNNNNFNNITKSETNNHLDENIEMSTIYDDNLLTTENFKEVTDNKNITENEVIVDNKNVVENIEKIINNHDVRQLTVEEERFYLRTGKYPQKKR